MSMITTAAWVRRGVAAQFPTKYEIDEEEMDRISKLARIQLEGAREDLQAAKEEKDASADHDEAMGESGDAMEEDTKKETGDSKKAE